ncbi:hypothetical protein EV1_025363 [Malus domestica]
MPLLGDWNNSTLRSEDVLFPTGNGRFTELDSAISFRSQTSVKYVPMAPRNYGCRSHLVSSPSSIAITLYSMGSPTKGSKVEHSLKNK